MSPPGGRLTTHVLDTATGRPGAGLGIVLARLEDGRRIELGRYRTDADGRCAAPLLEGAALRAGSYELLFEIAAWRGADRGLPDPGLPGPGFYDEIPIRFRVADPGAHHHVPLILSPFGYATYRGS